jgi:integrase
LGWWGFVAATPHKLPLFAKAFEVENSGNTGNSLGNMKARYFVSPNASRPGTWKLEIPAVVSEAWAAGPALLEALQKTGTEGLREKDQGGLSMRSAVRDYIATKAKASKDHRAKIERVCGKLLEEFEGPVANVTPLKAGKWFDGIEGSPTTRAGWHRYASGFFAWCVDMEILDRNPLRRIKAPKAEAKRSLVTAAEMVTIFEAEMSDPLRAWFLLGGFAGLRSIEVRRMRWEDVDAAVGEIEIRREVSKQSTGLPERIVDFTEPLTKRAAFFLDDKKKGLILPPDSLRIYAERQALIRRLHEAGKLPWSQFPENALRHSYATYHLGRCQDAGKTAHQLGHSTTAMVKRVYAVPSRRADWRAWWVV